MNKRIFTVGKLSIFLVVCLFSSVAGAIYFKKQKPQQTITVVEARTGKINSSYFNTGTLNFQNQAKLSAEILAKVKDIYVKEGQRVSKGEKLILLDDSSIQSDLSIAHDQIEKTKVDIARAEKEVEFSKAELARQEKLFNDGIIARKTFDETRVAFERASYALHSSQKAINIDIGALNQKRKLYEKTIIRSPVDGVVISIPIKIGETAVPSATSIAGSELLIIAESGAMVVEAQVNEQDIGRVKVGQLANVIPRALSNVSIPAKVTYIASSVTQPNRAGADTNTNSKNIAIKLVLMENPSGLTAGTSCEIQLLEGSLDGGIIIPMDSILFDEVRPDEKYIKGSIRNYYVWVLENGKARKRSVELGLADESLQEITKGLRLGEKILRGSAETLSSIKENDAISAKSGKF